MSVLSTRVLTKPNQIREWLTEVAEIEAERISKRLAEMAETSIKMWIMNTSKMPTGALADAFFKEQTGPYSWGIGNISYLNDNANYWRHINFGSEAIGANWDHFTPNGPTKAVVLEGTPDKMFGQAHNPIPAHNYIEKTIADLEVAIQQVISGR